MRVEVMEYYGHFFTHHGMWMYSDRGGATSIRTF